MSSIRFIVASIRNRNSRLDTVTTCSQKTKNDRVFVVLATTKLYESFISCIQVFIIDSHDLACAINELIAKKHEKSMKYRQFDSFFQESSSFRMLEFFDTSVAMWNMSIKEVFKDEELFAMTTLAKKFEKSNTHVFERIDFNFSRLTHDFRISKLFIES